MFILFLQKYLMYKNGNSADFLDTYLKGAKVKYI